MGPARRPTKTEARPKGPIRERNTGRVFDVDDLEGDADEVDNIAASAAATEDLDDVATSASATEEDGQD